MTALGSPLDEGHGDSRLRHRRVILLGVVALVVIAAIGGLLVSTQIKSPAQQAAQTKPPPLTQLTAAVQRTVLTATVLGQAAVGAPKEYSPSTLGSGGGGDGSPSQNVQSIVTRVFVRNGSYVGQGTVMFEVAGQPFFLLQGSVPTGACSQARAARMSRSCRTTLRPWVTRSAATSAERFSAHRRPRTPGRPAAMAERHHAGPRPRALTSRRLAAPAAIRLGRRTSRRART
jgi:hypothetical protein